ncbi:MAG: hypothetical protein KDE33_30100 [Bacteroidetes bacterium]|nr:hypothetical protein [Bacteroidota bacterium]
MKNFVKIKKKKTDANNVYDGHAQQKLVTPHIRDRWASPEKKEKGKRLA